MPSLSSAALLIATAASDDHFYTGFHAQPLHNWLNDPNGPMFFNGMYHLFFQYNPNDWNWGDMHWYHMVSKDMVTWEHLPVALAPDQDYDCGGIFSGSATIVRNETTGEDVPILSYSVACGKSIVNAVPADLSDPKLVDWTKPSYNPVIPMPSSASGGFRDPTTAWKGKDGVWRMLVGCVNSACQFKSTNFIDWTYVGALHSHGTGMWECPDFYQLPDSDLWLFKASINGDWWTVGEYEEVSDPTQPDKFTPKSQGDILENNQKYDQGEFYASKGFRDPDGRYINFGWVNYHCAGTDWSGVQTVPRSVTSDPADPTRILTNPVKELNKLRYQLGVMNNVVVKAGSSYPAYPPNLNGTQLDVEVSFSASQGLSGSFGVRSLVGDDVPEGFESGVPMTIAMQDSGATLEGQPFSIDAGDPVTMRVLVDKSIVEAYAQGGRAVATRHFCPTLATSGGVEVFNSGTEDISVDITVHRMMTANTKPSSALFV